MKSTKPDPSRVCHNCVYHYDEHCKANDGHLILCRCPFYKWSRIQNSMIDACEKFKRIPKTIRNGKDTILGTGI